MDQVVTRANLLVMQLASVTYCSLLCASHQCVFVSYMTLPAGGTCWGTSGRQIRKRDSRRLDTS